jgi:hypothetical protein
MLSAVDRGTAMEFWIDGVKVAEARTELGARNTGTAAFAIGGHGWPPTGGSMDATIDHRGLLAMAGQWNRPLNEAEMTALYNSGRGRRYESLSREESSMGRRRVVFSSAVFGKFPWLWQRQQSIGGGII